MTFATTINLVTIILCLAVLVQCARLMRSLKAFRTADLPATARALDGATKAAHGVLRELRDELSWGGEPTLKVLVEARSVSDELGVMIGIANATADRMLDNARELQLTERELAA